jgi:hypothetical protein
LVEEAVAGALPLLRLEQVVVGVDDMCPLEHVFSVHSNILKHHPPSSPHFNHYHLKTHCPFIYSIMGDAQHHGWEYVLFEREYVLFEWEY